MTEQGVKETIKPKKRNKLLWSVVSLLTLLALVFVYFSFFAPKSSDAERSFMGNTFANIAHTTDSLRDSLGEFFFGIERPAVVDEENEAQPSDPDEEGGTQNSPDSNRELAPFPPPAAEGAQTTILDAVNPNLLGGVGAFVINAELRANGNLVVSGSSRLIDLIASEIVATRLGVSGATSLTELEVTGSTRILASLEALGGIRTGGANIDLEGGDIIGLDYISSIEAGENVVITGTRENPIISVPDAGRTSSGGSSGVRSLNGERGEVNLLAGSDIAINGLSISNTSTLESVRARGGCVACLLDEDIADDLTIVGGTINSTVIGDYAPAEAYFTNVFIGNGGQNELSVVGGATFTGTVRGADAVDLDEFVTLSQLDAATGGGATGGVASLNGLYGHVNLAGTAGQIGVSTTGSTITLALPQDISVTSSPTFAGLSLTGGLIVGADADIFGTIRGFTFESAPGDATVRKSGEQILRSEVSVFPYALPADTGSTNFVPVSKSFTSSTNNPVTSVAPPIAGTTREYRLAIKYSDSVPTAAQTEWRIIDPNTSLVLDTFTTAGLNRSDLENPEVFISAPVSISSDHWLVEVRVPSGRVRVTDIHILSFDILN